MLLFLIKEKDIVPTKIVTKVPETPFEPPTVQSTGLEQSENPTETGEIDNQGKIILLYNTLLIELTS